MRRATARVISGRYLGDAITPEMRCRPPFYTRAGLTMAIPTRGDTLLPMVRRLLGDHVAVIMISTLGDMGLIQRCLFSGEAAASSLC